MKPINIFDFDGTLTTQTWPKFWVWVKKFGYNGEKRNEQLETALAEYRTRNLGNELETFFAFFNDLLVDSHETITYEELMKGEQYIEYNLGVRDFLAKSRVANYIVSGGLKEFLQNLETAKYFAGIYGTPIKHNESSLISGIGEVMTDERKILAICDILKKNNRQENDCENVCYVGDGYSDAAAMRFVHNHGGKAIFVYQPNQKDDLYYEYNQKIYEMLNENGMVDFFVVADFRKDSALYKILEKRSFNLE